MGAYLVWFPNVRIRTVIFLSSCSSPRSGPSGCCSFWFVLQFFTEPGRAAWPGSPTSAASCSASLAGLDRSAPGQPLRARLRDCA